MGNWYFVGNAGLWISTTSSRSANGWGARFRAIKGKWRESQHKTLLFATVLALWWGEKNPRLYLTASMFRAPEPDADAPGVWLAPGGAGGDLPPATATLTSSAI